MIGEGQAARLAFGIGACAVFVLLSGFFSGAETGLYCIDRLRLRIAAHKGDRSSRLLERLIANQSGLLFVTLVGTNAANYLAPVCATFILLETSLAQRAEFYTTVILTPIVFIFGEIVPKNLFQRHSDRFMPRAAPILAVGFELLRATGIIRLQNRISDFILRRLGKTHGSMSAFQPRAEVYQMLREAAEDGAITQAQSVMLERVRSVRSVRVGSVMVPRSSAVMLPIDATRRQVERTAAQVRHSRLPVYRNGPRDIVGVVHLLDLLTGRPDAGVEEHLIVPLTLRRDEPVGEALSQMRRGRRRMGIVVNHNGECIGIVTVKDLVEEIVGELATW